MSSLSFGGGNASSYYDRARQGQVYVASATITSPVIYSTAAGAGGPLLWNNSQAAGKAVNAVILAVSAVLTTASTVAAALGLTGNSGQTSAPTSTTAIGAIASTLVGSNVGPLCNAYSVGTVSRAGGFFMPTHTLDTGAITAVNVLPSWVDISGAVVVPPGSWAAIAASATATSAVVNIGVMWAEVPI